MAPSTTAKRQQLRDLCTSCQEIEDNFTRLEQLGGIEGLVRNILNLSWSTVAQGLADAAAVQSKRVEFGANALPETPRSTWMEEFIKCIKEDEIVQVLCVSAVVSLAIGTWENPNTGWIEGTAINMAVLIVGAVTATNETQSAEQFEALDSEEKDIRVKCLRDGGIKTEILSSSLVVGDIVVLEPGDKLPADCLLVDPNEGLRNGTPLTVDVDEAALTGETKVVRKSCASDPFLFAGSTVTDCGSREQVLGLVYLVGVDTQLGRLMAKVRRPEQKTPLAVRLDALAEDIGGVGKAAAIATFSATTLLFAYRWLTMELPVGDGLVIGGAGYDSEQQVPFGGLPLAARHWGNLFGPHLFGAMLQSFLLAVTIVVVAVPEGLPLAVTISLAYSVKSMLKDNNLVRKMKACETMGNATTICSDKTGTLTTNQMTVVKAVAWGDDINNESCCATFDITDGSRSSTSSLENFAASITRNNNAGRDVVEALRDITNPALSIEQTFALGVALNTTADLKDGSGQGVIGNRTEGALLLLLRDMGIDYNAARSAFKKSASFSNDGRTMRVAARRAFNSKAKIMSVLVLCQAQEGGEIRGIVFTKGAAEIVLDRCAKIAGKGEEDEERGREAPKIGTSHAEEQEEDEGGGMLDYSTTSTSPSLLNMVPSVSSFGSDGPSSFREVALLKLKEKRENERRDKFAAFRKMKTPEPSQRGSTTRLLSAKERGDIMGTIREFNQRQLRSLALAHRTLSAQDTQRLLEASAGAKAYATGNGVALESIGDLGLSGEHWDSLALDSGLILDALVGIKDPLRPGVASAVRTCQEAGIVVRMITGDNADTAQAIAAECGILSKSSDTTNEADTIAKADKGEEGELVMTGPDFRRRFAPLIEELEHVANSGSEDGNGDDGNNNEGNDEDSEAAQGTMPSIPIPEVDAAALRSLRVLARSSPDDKHNLVRLLQCLGEVVGVTGDGMNDGPALKAAQVGLAMNICGTDVAKEASDIIIMDDNFASIVNTVKWGRCVFDNIRRFLQFQLTVNAVALTITFICAATGLEPPLNAVMMLWVNLIMDTMGALALATELPTPGLLRRRPYPLDAPLISGTMWRNIAFQSCFQLAALAWVLSDQGAAFIKGGSDHEGGGSGDILVNDLEKNTLVFNAFVACQVRISILLSCVCVFLLYILITPFYCHICSPATKNKVVQRN